MTPADQPPDSTESPRPPAPNDTPRTLPNKALSPREAAHAAMTPAMSPAERAASAGTAALARYHAEIPRCGAPRNFGRGACANPAGMRTRHHGQGRCWMHGGLAPKDDKRLKSGRYSGIEHPTLGDLTSAMADDPDPLNLLDDLALARAVLVTFLEEYELQNEALLEWFAHMQMFRRPIPTPVADAFEHAISLYVVTETARGVPNAAALPRVQHARDALAMLRGDRPVATPKKVRDLGDVIGMLDKIGNLAERIDRMRHNQNAVSEAELSRIFGAMCRVVDVVCAGDDEKREKIREGFLSIASR